MLLHGFYRFFLPPIANGFTCILFLLRFHCFVYSGIFSPACLVQWLRRRFLCCAWQRRSRSKPSVLKLICALMSAFTVFLFTFFFASAKFNWMIDRSICNCTLITQTTSKKRGERKGRNTPPSNSLRSASRALFVVVFLCFVLIYETLQTCLALDSTPSTLRDWLNRH